MDTVPTVQSVHPPTHALTRAPTRAVTRAHALTRAHVPTRASTQARTRLPAAVSPLVADIVGGPTQAARVLGVFSTAVYLGLSRHDTVLPVLARDALALPTGIRLGVASHELSWPVRPGDAVDVGEGRIGLGSVTIHAARTWSPPRVTAASPGVRPLRVDRPSSLRVDRPSPLRSRVADVVRCTDAVGTLVGLGPGLTPSGDDALCGALLALRAAGSTRLGSLRQGVSDRLDGTTSLSASLLCAAMEGYAVPCVVRLASALAAGDEDAADAALPEVLAIGNSSGSDVVAGLLGAFDALDAAAALTGADR